MAELLNFRRGELAGLKNITPSASTVGTVYVTTDEQAMYIDTYVKNKTTNAEEIKRIRLSDIIQIDSYAQWQQMPPPYSSSALYYIIEQNALLKYIGDGTNHSWKQINSTSDIQADLTNLTTRVTNAETNITQLGTRVGTVETAIGNASNPADGTIRKRLNDIEAEQITQNDRLTATEEVANAAKDAIGTTGDTASASGSLYARIAQNKKDIATNTSSITSINGKLGEKNDPKDKDTAFGRIKALEEANVSDDSRLDSLETAVGSAGQEASATGSLYQRVKKNAADISGLTTKVNTNTSDITSIKTQLTGIGNKNTEQDNLISGLRTDLGTNDKTDGSTAFSRIAALENASSTQGTDVSDLKTAVQQLKDKNDTQDGLISGNSSAITTLSGKVDGNTSKINTNTSNITNLQTRMTTAEGDIDALENLTTNLRNDLGTKPANGKTAFESIAQNTTDIGKLNTSFTTLNGDVQDHESRITENEKDISALETSLGNKDQAASATGSAYQRIKQNAADISALAGRVTTNEGNISKNTTDIGTLKSNLTTLQSNSATKAELKEVKDDLAQVEQDLLDNINDKIVAANAMEYQKTVNTYAELPTTNVKVGYTYVAGHDFYMPSGSPYDSKKVHAGDLIIATGTEDSSTGFITAATLYWDVIDTGYTTLHENKIVDAGNNVLKLQSYTGADLSSITFTGTGAARVAVTHSDTAAVTNTVTVSLEWDTF